MTRLWITGHSECRENDITDTLARRGSREKLIGHDPVVIVCREIQYRKIVERTSDDHQKYWETLEVCRQAKASMGSNLPCKWRKDTLRANRKLAQIFTAIVTGHEDFHIHLHKMGLANNPLYRHSENYKETFTHVLGHCQRPPPKGKSS